MERGGGICPNAMAPGMLFINASQSEGLFEKILKELEIDCDLQDISIDSTIIKVHQDAGSEKKLWRKYH